VVHGEQEQVLTYPIASPAALEPPVEWERLRGRCPVARVTLPSGDEAALLTRYDDVKQVLSDARFGRLLNAPDAARLTDSESGGVFNSAMANTLPQEGAGHQRWRRMIVKWFTAKRMAALRPGIEDMANQLVDAMVTHGHPADLKAGLGFPLPVWVICALLGVPDADRDRFAHWSDNLLNLTRYTQAETDAAQAEFGAYLAAHVTAKRAEPGEDLLSELIANTDAGGERLSDALLVATGQALLVAGHETTANMIGLGVLALLQNPDQAAVIRDADEPKIVANAVEELLRYLSIIQNGQRRVATEDIHIAGETIRANDGIIIDLAPANWDPDAFAEPDRLYVHRAGADRNVAFGYGRHQCVGQQLARAELQIVFQTVLRRIPTMKLAVPFEAIPFKHDRLAYGVYELPVTW
jgi:cytochrome P450